MKQMRPRVLPKDVQRHVFRAGKSVLHLRYDRCCVVEWWDVHLVYWMYSGAVINTFILTSTWLTVTMAVGRYLAVSYPFHIKPMIDLRCTRFTIAAIFAVSFLVNVPRLFENTVQSIPCPQTSLTILIQSPGPLQTFDRRLMRVYVWLYCVLGIFVPLTLLAAGNCGLVTALRRSTRLRRQFHVRHSHVDANERVTTVLATVDRRPSQHRHQTPVASPSELSRRRQTFCRVNTGA